jgi:hypothetical protein
MAKWIQKATAGGEGGLHESLGVSKKKKIPPYLIAMAAKEGGKVGKQGRLAQTLKELK